MELVSPLNIAKIDRKLKLPITLLDRQGSKVVIEKFSIKEKEWFFGLQELEIFNQKEGERFKCKKAGSLFNLSDCHEFILANYKVIIKKDTDNPWLLQRIQEQLDFVFKILTGCGFPFHKIRNINTLFNNSAGFTNKHIISRRENIIINRDLIERFKKLLLLLIEEKRDKGRIELLKFLVDTAMSQVPNLGIAGALYVSILESILVPERDTEIRYRFSLRLSKIKNKGIQYQKCIKELYDKRSSIFHGGKDKFSKSDLEFLEQETCWLLEQYLLNPDKFSQENLDQVLLN